MIRRIRSKFILERNVNKVVSITPSVIKRHNFSQETFSTGLHRIKTPMNAYYNHFTSLKLPDNKIFATYVWIDGSGITLRSKDRVLNEVPTDLSMVPKWNFDGSSTGQAHTDNSDTVLLPVAIYSDPLRQCPHVIVLCETYYSDGSPTPTNHRATCAETLSKISDQEPWFGIEQEYTLFDSDLWPLGWPKVRGYPVTKAKYSYCGVGEHVAGRDLVECHARACVYSGMDFCGSNAEVMMGSWEYQVGTTAGIKAADDLWVGRYLLTTIAEMFGIIVSFHPKPMGMNQPGIGCHHNFSTKKMRDDGGLEEIERVCDVLCQKHESYMKHYGLGDSQENRKRLTGKFETASYENFRWGVADRGASIRLQRSVQEEKKGFLEDRRPAGDCDPYRVCALLAEACI
ncbi:glutamine synthetase 1, mitochondrial-like [Helicoverpa zea]|uniref:glutamine synthetase 1, mitochondrial-like n=1 Tax=Helicoverpa zea TaxID=7113 RepID=UPI001F56CDD6|nr:glutamine synthetase 1, mitochondrial-like [Helicoverpa zea]